MTNKFFGRKFLRVIVAFGGAAFWLFLLLTNPTEAVPNPYGNVKSMRPMYSQKTSCFVWQGRLTQPTVLEFPVQNENALLRARQSEVYYTILTPNELALREDDTVHFRKPYLYFVTPEKGTHKILAFGSSQTPVRASYEVCEI